MEVGIWLSPLKDAPKPEREVGKKEYNEILYTKRYAPLIYAQIPAKLMAEIENMPEVDGIYVAREFKPLINMVAQTERVQSLGFEYTYV